MIYYKIKDNSVNISNLHPVFLVALNEVAKIHYDLTGKKLLVTSGNDGRHWGSIKKEDRPQGWKNFTEEEVRAVSDSLHYPQVDGYSRAVDFRDYYVWEMPELIYDGIEFFTIKVNSKLNNPQFQLIHEKDHFHFEWDKKIELLDERKPILDLEGDIRLKNPVEWQLEEVGTIDLPAYNISVPFYCNPKYLKTGKNVLMATVNFVSGRITGVRIFEPKQSNGFMETLKDILQLILKLIKKEK